ncbi:DNA-binding response regulator [Mycetocola tolaasinivorans]|uniref:DNA-binding response regulator n=1 Tax=Mycetocola tolaasinivorans TaxID=76635 RepID=A0A3L7A814_9MICO|nr:response regulator transcription factor [Mycetocola tolaasinivorans]RLP75741.1 DNA-binding response regulator [Mycetocola tolaasinivorans]
MRVLIVDDEQIFADTLRIALTRESMAVDVCHDGGDALELLAINDYDVCVLDRDIPGVHGDEVCRQIVASEDPVPVLMLTAARRLGEKVAGFGLGADDYLTKPFDLPELVVRIRALARRPRRALPPVLAGLGIELNAFRHEVTRDGIPIRLSRKEFAVLELILAAGGSPVSAETLLEKAWDENANPFTNSTRMTVSALRRKLGEPWVIQTVSGVGYRLGLPDAAA